MTRLDGSQTPHHRGVMDCYYRSRLGQKPHYYRAGGETVIEADMTPDEVAEYRRGWDEQEAAGDRWEDEQDW